MDHMRTSTIGVSSPGVSRRGFLAGSVGVGVLTSIGMTGLDFWFDTGWAFADGPTVGLPPSGTTPEQLHLTWGADPSTAVTVSWASPGTVAQPMPSMVFSTGPIGLANPGTSASVTPMDFTDQMNLETVHWYHAALQGLTPDTVYYYQVSDGASPASVAGSNFRTAPSPASRPKYRFTSYGDLSTPTAAHNASGQTWTESSDNSYYAVQAIEDAATAQPLFHLLNGDLCYANLNTNNQPEVWRDFGRNMSASAANRPWMPCLGNHEIEFGTSAQDGTAGGGHFNSRFGYGSYQTRFALPDNGVSGYRGNFYSFRVGTVVFVSLDADDVIYQDGGSFYAPANTQTTPLTSTNPAVSIPPGTSTYNHSYTGKLAAGPDNTLVPDTSSATPNLQTRWLAQTLAASRADSTVDMIVVQMHQCALSSSSKGNGSDLGIRQAWYPLFDQYSVDLVLSGHEHNYERSFAVRSHDTGALGTVVAANPGQAPNGTKVDTRRPSVVSAAQTTVNGNQAFDTSLGTVYLVLGGGGTDGPTNVYGTDTSGPNPVPQAKMITTRNLIYPSGAGYVKNGADSIEDAPWSARIDAADAYGYAVFDVDPGVGAGQTTITMTYYHAPRTGSGTSYAGTTSYSPYETVVFGRGLGPPAQTPEFGAPAVALGAAAVVGAGALYLSTRCGEADTAAG